ncbi:hypothetical protein GCM10027598_81170 [Amycolatopsis oliviviridis]
MSTAIAVRKQATAIVRPKESNRRVPEAASERCTVAISTAQGIESRTDIVGETPAEDTTRKKEMPAARAVTKIARPTVA